MSFGRKPKDPSRIKKARATKERVHTQIYVIHNIFMVSSSHISRIAMLVPTNKHGNTAPHDVKPGLLFLC